MLPGLHFVQANVYTEAGKRMSGFTPGKTGTDYRNCGHGSILLLLF